MRRKSKVTVVLEEAERRGLTPITGKDLHALQYEVLPTVHQCRAGKGDWEDLPYGSIDLFYSVVKNMARRGTIRRKKNEKDLWVYYLNEQS